MKKINTGQISSFAVMFVTSITSGGYGAWLALKPLPLGDFRGIAIVAGAVPLAYLASFLVYRLFLTSMPLRLGPQMPGSRAEFSAQVNILFYLMIFNSLVRTHFVPVPLMRVIYLALGAKLGRNTYSAGALLDPPLTTIGNNTIIGHDALVFAHVIEGDRFELYTVRIGNDVTIGGHAAIMPDVEIGDGAIVSIGAVVTKGTRIGAGEIWGGVPARRIGVRSDYPPAQS